MTNDKGLLTSLAVISQHGLIAKHAATSDRYRTPYVAAFAYDRALDYCARPNASAAAHNGVLDSRTVFDIAVAAYDGIDYLRAGLHSAGRMNYGGRINLCRRVELLSALSGQSI